jgi:HD-like signal output (HDOD) protein
MEPQMSTQSEPAATGRNSPQAQAFARALVAEIATGRAQIPSFPDVAVHIRKVLADENCEIAQVERVVGAEPALAARLLQMANSAALNPAGVRVTELRTAIARIGFAHVRTASLSYAMHQIRGASALAPIRAPLNQLWERCVRVAAMAFVAARSWSKVSADQALLAGMMHAMGKVFILTRSVDHPGVFADAAAYQRIVNQLHVPIARVVLRSLDVSPEIIAAVENHEKLDREAEGEPDLTDVLTIASLLVSFGTDPEALEAQLAGTSACQRMGLTQASVSKVLQESAAEVTSLQSALGD